MIISHLQTVLTAALFILPTTSSQSTIITCPSVGGTQVITASTSASTLVQIPVISNTNDVTLLCTLIRSDQDGSNRVPVARSYGARWEASAGHYAKTGSGLGMNCFHDVPTPYCEFTLPPVDESQQYVLETYQHSITKEAEAARFLEQATFGTTKEDLQALMATDNNFTQWVYDQMYNIPMSSHREFYRKRTNPKFEFPQDVGTIGPTPCEKFSRWRKYSLTSRDTIQGRRTAWNKFLTITQSEGIVGYIWKVDGQFRTITKEQPRFTDGTLLELGTRYRIPDPDGISFKQDCVGCLVPIGDFTGYIVQHYLVNPPVSIDGVEGRSNELFPYRVVNLPPFKSSDFITIENPSRYHHVFAQWIHADENGLLNTTSLQDTDQCDGHPNFWQPLPVNNRDAPPGALPSVFGRSVDASTGEVHIFAFDPHLALRENTVENPLEDGGGDLVMKTNGPVAGAQTLCQNAEMNFLNEKNCKLSYSESACMPNSLPKRVIVLDQANQVSISNMTGRKIFTVTGFSLTDIDPDTGVHYVTPPCRPGSRTSRWIRNDDVAACENSANLGAESIETFRDIIDAASIGMTDQYYNPKFVDVTRNVLECDLEDMHKYHLGAVEASDGSCWIHSHPYERSVFDLTILDPSEYTVVGNAVAAISSELLYKRILASDRLMYPLLGKYGDHVELDGNEWSLLNDENVQKKHQLDFNPSKRAVLVCGSPGEVASDPFHGDQGFDVVMPESAGYRSTSIFQLAAQKHTIWAHLALHAKDQLRQRVAFALSQIIAVGLITVNGSRVFLEKTEPHLELYDQFVRNGFGSYRDLMREFSYNVLMAEWLSFVENKSLQWNINNGNGPNYPDENFAREIMQLFSIGLYRINPGGSQVLTENGFPIEAYTMDDIFSYSRAWTGFVRRPVRGGASTASREWFETSSLDPMGIDPAGRDVFPKTDLSGDYIGNRVAPLCVDLPKKHHLRRGATYKLLGGSSSPVYQHDPKEWATNPDLRRIELKPSSPLYVKLCEPSSQEQCTFPSTIKLDTNLVYDDGTTLGEEFSVDTLRTVVIKYGLTSPIYYEYIRQPCVELAFFENGKKVIKGQISRSYVQRPSMCGNPYLEIATPMCSETGWSSRESEAQIFCHYQGERVTYEAAEAICRENGLEQSHPWILLGWDNGPCGQGIVEEHFRSWSNAECSVYVKIALDSGNIAIVHDPSRDYAGFKDVEPMVREDTMNFFKAYWLDDYPTREDCLSMPACYLHFDQKSCICKTTLHESEYFTKADELIDASNVFHILRNGAVDPTVFDVGVYKSIGGCGIPGLDVYSTDGADCNNFNADTILSLQFNGVTYFLKNMKSLVFLQGSEFSFRNPPHFVNMIDPAARDVIYETEAVLDSLFYHPNHPTFLAIRLIQRFGISNPSPEFVIRVSEAYKAGSYHNFGSGTYGDLGAMVAAILLDSESRAAALDMDQSHGHLREPLIKVVSFFRSMGLSYASPLHIPTLLNLYDKIGQGSYETPSVFSFFLPEFSASNMRGAELASPEAMVLQSQRVIGLIDSFYSTIKTGISNCYYYTFDGSRGDDRGGNQNFLQGICATEEGDTSLSTAHATYWPASTSSAQDIVEELRVLLTSGRLTDENKAIILSYVEKEMNGGDVAKAVRIAQELMLSTPEFHVTNTVRKQDDIRESFGYLEEPKSAYKAVVVLMMVGGLDSFNVLLPKGQCVGADQYQKYQSSRGPAHAVPLSRLASIYAHGSNQTCLEYGVNMDFDLLAELYNNKELLFLANTGVLSKPMDRADWLKQSSFQPFAHNIMQHEFYAGDPYNVEIGTGVFGRMLDWLKDQCGHQTAAYAVNGGEEMLTGDPSYGNSVQSLSATPPQDINSMPTLEDMYDIAKELNGLGNSSNSFFGEAFASSFSSALFDHSQMQEVASIPDFNIPSSQFPVSRIATSLRAVAQNMRSRNHRKVNREVYVVNDFGYDQHFGNGLSELLNPVNDALKQFVRELKAQGIWEDTLIVLGSDFGRSITANSNGGTDHAWGGNFFLAGGGVKGGQILGQYPDFSTDNPAWIDRGRFVPTTPWDAVNNGIAQWLGIRDENGLNYAVPNRHSFGECVLFHDSQLFRDGTCACGAGCSDPSSRLRSAPITNDMASADQMGGNLAASIIDKESIVNSFGCREPTPKEIDRATDQTTEKFFCERSSLYNAAGIIVTSSTPRWSIAKGIRLYSQNNCPECDVVSYILEGRTNDESGWTLISEGDLPWITKAPPRNALGNVIESSYEQCDTRLHLTSVDFSSNSRAFVEYRVTFSGIRDPTSKFIQFAEVEIPGLMF